MNKWRLGTISNVVLASLLCAQAAVVPPPWADPNHNPCASQPGGWQLIYWPADKKCYRIFQRGYPCPETMELGPGIDKGTPECNCPPGSAQHNVDGLCYPIFQQGPCEMNEYFAPEPDRADRQRLGKCVSPEPCTELNSIYHPREKKCYQKYTKGPCPEGQLVTTSKQSPLIGECRCDTDEMSEFYWEPGSSCHQHFTIGPCQERGGLFLPGGICGCHNNLPHYHNATSKCYQLGGLGPCPPGHQFTIKSKKYAECICKDGYVKWSGDGSCYRPYTRGPCAAGHMYSVNITSSGMEIGCVPVPCSTGKLYFPGGKGCHRVGTQGPCPTGQLVLFQDSVKTSVEGISYLGMCGCARYNQENTFFPTPFGTDGTNSCDASPRLNDGVGKIQAQKLSKEPREDICINKRGMITWADGTCRQLYAQGPCSAGEWVVPDRGKGQRQGRGWWKGKCECRPGYTVTVTTVENENKTLCQAPTVVLAKFLNTKSNQHKYRNKNIPPQEEFDENGNKIENSSPKSRYTTKLSHVRNNSKVTKLASLLKSEEEEAAAARNNNERTKISYARNNEENHRRNNKYKNMYEQHRRMSSSEKPIVQEPAEKTKEEIVHTSTINPQDTPELKHEDATETVTINHDTQFEESTTEKPFTDTEISNEKVEDSLKVTKTNENEETQADDLLNNTEHKDVTRDDANEVIKIAKINKQISEINKQITNRINSKTLRLDNQNTLNKIFNLQVAVDNEKNKENVGRKGRKHQVNDETYRTHMTIHDDINEYIRKQQNQDNEEKVKNHKADNNKKVAVINSRDENSDLNQNLNKSSEPLINGELTKELLPERSSEDINLTAEDIDELTAQSNSTSERVKLRTEDRRNNHKLEDENEEETLIMVEDKKDRTKVVDLRKHIKDYVKPIIIFE